MTRPSPSPPLEDRKRRLRLYRWLLAGVSSLIALVLAETAVTPMAHRAIAEAITDHLGPWLPNQ